MLGLTKVPCSTKEYLTRKLVLVHYAELKFQLKVKIPNLWLLEKHAAQRKALNPMVIVIALHGQRVKCSQMSLLLLLMRNNGLRASLKHGKLQPRTVILNSNNLLRKPKREKKMENKRESKKKRMPNVENSRLENFVKQNGICVPGKRVKLKLKEVNSDSTVTWLQRPHLRKFH